MSDSYSPPDTPLDVLRRAPSDTSNPRVDCEQEAFVSFNAARLQQDIAAGGGAYLDPSSIQVRTLDLFMQLCLCAMCRDKAQRDILAALEAFNDIHVATNLCEFPGVGPQMNCITLDGTVPVNISGKHCRNAIEMHEHHVRRYNV